MIAFLVFLNLDNEPRGACLCEKFLKLAGSTPQQHLSKVLSSKVQFGDFGAEVTF